MKMVIAPDVVMDRLDYHDVRLVSTSGGPDSMLLLERCRQQKGDRQLLVWTGHHGQRGDAHQDVALVQGRCDAKEVTCFVGYYDGSHTETAMRNWRKGELVSLAHKYNGCVLTGHHLDDRIETVMYRLWKGTGLLGMSALSPVYVGDVAWVRPLIDVTKEQILEYCGKYDVSYCLDSTNTTSEGGPRNRIRHIMIPLLRSDDFYPTWRGWFAQVDERKERLISSVSLIELPSSSYWSEDVQCRGCQIPSVISWTASLVGVTLSRLGCYLHQKSSGIEVLVRFFRGEEGDRMDYGDVILRNVRGKIIVTGGGVFWEEVSGKVADDYRLSRTGDKWGSQSLTRFLQKQGVPVFWRSSVLVCEDSDILTKWRMPEMYEARVDFLKQ